MSWILLVALASILLLSGTAFPLDCQDISVAEFQATTRYRLGIESCQATVYAKQASDAEKMLRARGAEDEAT